MIWYWGVCLCKYFVWKNWMWLNGLIKKKTLKKKIFLYGCAWVHKVSCPLFPLTNSTPFTIVVGCCYCSLSSLINSTPFTIVLGCLIVLRWLLVCIVGILNLLKFLLTNLTLSEFELSYTELLDFEFPHCFWISVYIVNFDFFLTHINLDLCGLGWS